MSAALGVYLAAAARDRGVLQPIAALLFVLLGVFAYRPNDVESTWALTALLCFPLTAWLLSSVVRSLTDSYREMIVVALGGAKATDRSTSALGGALAVVVTGVFVAYPLIIGAFERPVGGRDLVDGVLAHLCCAVLGAQLGRAAAPPVVTRRANVAVMVIVATLVSVAAASIAGVAGGPMAVADAFAGGVSVRLYAACCGCLVFAAALGALRRKLVRRLG